MKILKLFVVILLLVGFASMDTAEAASKKKDQLYNTEEGLNLYYSQFEDGEVERQLDNQSISKDTDSIQTMCIACVPQPTRLSLMSTTRQNNVFVKALGTYAESKHTSGITWASSVTTTLSFSGSVTADIRDKAKSQFGLQVSVSKSYSTSYTFKVDPSLGRLVRPVQRADRYNKYIKATKEYYGRPTEVSYFYAYEPIQTFVTLQYSN